MKDPDEKSIGNVSSRSANFLMLAALLAVGVAVVIDLAVLDVALLAEGEPDFSLPYMARTLLVAMGSGLFVAAVVQYGIHRDNRSASNWDPAWRGWGTLRWIPDSPAKHGHYSLTVKQFIIISMVLMSMAFVAIFLVTPGFFSTLAREDRPVETLSAVVHLLNSGIFTYIAVVNLRNRNRGGYSSSLIAMAFALIFFLIGMEEISWFQRYFELDTPATFAENLQGEMNFHNFATNSFENAYYLSVFGLLILVPFLFDHGIFYGYYRFARIFAPSRFLVLAGAVFVTYNYDMWNILFTQIAFFVTLFILLYYTRAARRRGERVLLLVLIGAFVSSQLVFLAFGDRFVRPWDITEYKELLIPISCLFYALEVLSRAAERTAELTD